MIRIYEKKIVVEDDGTSLISADVYCNSEDTKPTDGFANGSTLTEVDTGSQYLFDEDNEEWVEVSEGGGGGGGSANSKETYTGTMNTLGDTLVSVCETHYTSGLEEGKAYMADDIKSGNLSSILVLDLSLLGGSPNYTLTSSFQPSGYYFDYINFKIDESNNMEGTDIACTVIYNGEQYEPVWSSNVSGKTYTNGGVMDISPYFANIPYTLTLYWHEMPSNDDI